MSWLAWPGVVLILGFTILVVFRKSIAALVDRTKKVGKIGLETFDTPQLPAPKDKPDALAEFMSTYDNPILLETESIIRADLQERGLAGGNAEKALIRSLAGTQMVLHFEQVNASIYASQVDLLIDLNSQPEGAPLAEAQTLYDEARRAWKDLYHGHTLDSWIGFLESYKLVELRDDHSVVLTRLGREFLKWRIETGKPGPFFG